MHAKTPKNLDDIRDAAQYIVDIAQGRSLEDYLRDRMLRQAIERNFEIIGEAMVRLTKLDPEVVAAIDDHRRIIAFRNVLAHGYDLIEDHRVWAVVREALPRLIKTVATLQARSGDKP